MFLDDEAKHISLGVTGIPVTTYQKWSYEYN